MNGQFPSFLVVENALMPAKNNIKLTRTHILNYLLQEQNGIFSKTNTFHQSYVIVLES